LVVDTHTPGVFSYCVLRFMRACGATSSLAAVGSALLVLRGACTLSSGGVRAVIDVVLVFLMGRRNLTELGWAVAVLACRDRPGGPAGRSADAAPGLHRRRPRRDGAGRWPWRLRRLGHRRRHLDHRGQYPARAERLRLLQLGRRRLDPDPRGARRLARPAFA